MAKKANGYKVHVRIYDRYDLDLIALSETKKFSLIEAMKQALKCYAAGIKLTIELPDLPEKAAKTGYVRAFTVELDGEEDADAIRLIKTIPDGFRNSFMKSILRASMDVAPISLYFLQNGDKFTRNMAMSKQAAYMPAHHDVVFTTQNQEEKPWDLSSVLIGTNRDKYRKDHPDVMPEKKKNTDKKEQVVETVPQKPKPQPTTPETQKPAETEEKGNILDKLNINLKTSDSTKDDDFNDIDDLLESMMG